MDRIERQIQLEADAIEKGIARFRKEANRARRHNKLGSDSLLLAIEDLSTAIRSEQESILRGRTKLSIYAVPLLSLEPDKLAFITLQEVLYLVGTREAAGSRTSVAHAARRIGERCRLERYYDCLRGRARNVSEILEKRFEERPNALREASRRAGSIDDDSYWSIERNIQLGNALLNLAINYTGVLGLDRNIIYSGGRPSSTSTLRLSDDIQASIAPPIHLPMIVKPKKWTGLHGGGYLTIPNMDLVKHQDNRAIVSALEEADLSKVWAAINALQETPWRINKRLYRIMRAAWEQGGTMGGLPPRHPPQVSTEQPEAAKVTTPDEAREFILSSRDSRRPNDRFCAELLLALEECGSLDHSSLTKLITNRLFMLLCQDTGRATGNETSQGAFRVALKQLVGYRLYQGLNRGWQKGDVNLEKCGLLRIEYSGLKSMCQNDGFWSQNHLLHNSLPEQREYMAMALLNRMKKHLAINAECLNPVAQRRIVRDVQANLKKPWSFGKREKLPLATVFIGPEHRAKYILNERSLSPRSLLRRLIQKDQQLAQYKDITDDEYISLVQGLLEALEKGELLVQATSATGKTGFQIRAEQLIWVKGDGYPQPVNPLGAPFNKRRHAETKVLSKRAVMQMRMNLCEELVNEECLYFPYQLDYRGRAYPVPQIFNPQSHDIGRALIDFADGKPLGKRGAYWLAVHLANTYGHDKVPFDKRVKWVKTHKRQITDSAENPLDGERFWEKADKPWCFLAACLEWIGYLKYRDSFKSHLPIAMDGTCNGLQHMSAMARDREGGQWTNLVPSGKPQDLYQRVANRLMKRLKDDANMGKDEARSWLSWLEEQEKTVPGIKRKLVKRATMTTPYGVQASGIRKQLIEDGFTAHLEEEEEWDVTDYLRRRLQDSIKDTVATGKVVEKRLKDVARTLANSNLGVCWTTPTGFRVVVEHRHHKKRRISTVLGSFQVDKPESPLILQKNKQVSTITPNFVHSMDAAHMMLTVNRLHKEGLQHFAMVHDSYGVHACDVHLTNRVLREEFVRIYREPVLAEFFTGQRNRNPKIKKLPEAPSPGNLDIDDVLYSEYFFS